MSARDQVPGTSAGDLAPEPGSLVVERPIRRARGTPAYRPESRPPVGSRLGPRLGCASDAYAALRDIHAADREHFVCFDLNVRHRVIARRVVAIGCLTGVDVHPREVYAGAIVNRAAAILIAHNHPSTDPTPSRQDIEITARLRDVGELVGITLLDHIIVAVDGFVSLADRGWV